MGNDQQRDQDLERLRLAHVQLTGVKNQLAGLVAAARTSGASWSQVAGALGTTKQSAWASYARLEDRPLSDPAFNVLFQTPQQ